MKTLKLWVIINLLDIVTTIIALNTGALEGQPLLNWVLSYGLWCFVLVKVALTALSVLVLYKLNRPNIIKGCNIGLGLIVLWNVLVILIR